MHKSKQNGLIRSVRGNEVEEAFRRKWAELTERSLREYADRYEGEPRREGFNAHFFELDYDPDERGHVAVVVIDVLREAKAKPGEVWRIWPHDEGSDVVLGEEIPSRIRPAFQWFRFRLVRPDLHDKVKQREECRWYAEINRKNKQKVIDRQTAQASQDLADEFERMREEAERLGIDLKEGRDDTREQADNRRSQGESTRGGREGRRSIRSVRCRGVISRIRDLGYCLKHYQREYRRRRREQVRFLEQGEDQVTEGGMH